MHGLLSPAVVLALLLALPSRLGTARAQVASPALGSLPSIGTITQIPRDVDPPGCSKPDPERAGNFLLNRIEAPRKEAWEEAHGGREAARVFLKERLAGWPTRALTDRAELPTDDEAFLRELARDTWNGLAALSDREHEIPIDHVRFCGGSLDPANVKIGDYTSVTNIGLHLMSTVGAVELGLVDHDAAVASIRRTLGTLGRLETYHGFFYNFYDTTTLERTSHFVSFVDSTWLSTALIIVRQSFPELWDDCSALLASQDYGLFYDPNAGLMLHGFTISRGGASRSRYHYGTLYTEARIGNLIAIGKKDAPEALWFRMWRTPPTTALWQSQMPSDRHEKTVDGHPVAGGTYEWNGLRYVPSWGGSAFEAWMPLIALDERTLAPASLGRNDEIHAEIQQRYALETLGLPVWGMSPSTRPNSIDYGEFGVPPLGIAGYPARIVTPHASALALAVDPQAATANLRRIAELYDAYGEYGFYDSVDPATGVVADAYLTLDQAMTFLALVNHLKDGVLQKRFAADPIIAPVLPLLRSEDFWN